MRNAFWLALLGLAMLGCGGGSSESTGGDHDHDHHAGGDTSQYDGPIASADTAAGAEHFQTFCEGCHPGGGAGVGPAIGSLAWTPGQMRTQIRHGEEQMPAFGEDRLPADGLEALVAYLSTIGAVAGDLPAAEGGDAGGDVAAE